MYRIGVTEAGWDNVSMILSKMEIPYYPISVRVFKNFDNIKDFNTIFINCSSPAFNFPWNEVSDNVKNFIFRGGSIYASDLAGVLIAKIFPEYLTLGYNHKLGTVKARTVDESLSAVLGKEISLEYDCVEFEVRNVSPSVRVYLKVGEDNVVNSFRYGDGELFYTTFHNHIQPSKQEEELLLFLVLKPLLLQTEKESSKQLEVENFKSKVQVFNTSKLSKYIGYSYIVEVPKPIRFFLNWNGVSKFKLSVFLPDGSLYDEKENSDPPIYITVKNPQLGRWSYRVTSYGKDSVPFVVNVAIESVKIDTNDTNMPSNESIAYKYCKYCGKKIRSTASFCSYCGHKQ